MHPVADFLNKQWSSSRLNRFITEELDVNEAFAEDAKGTLGRLVKYIQNECKLDQQEPIKGGSLGKGTAIRGKADIDVVLFLNGFRDMEHFMNGLKQELENIKQQLGNSQMYDSNNLALSGCTKHAVKFRLRKNSQNDYFNVDLLPAFDNLRYKSEKDVYSEMRYLSAPKREYYSSSFVKLQRDFVKEKPVLVKQLIRLVKYWRKTSFQGSEINGLPTSYLLELIAIDVWENQGGGESFDMKSMFRNVLLALTEPEQIEACWNINYDSALFRKDHGQNRPLVLDPANPFNNVASRCNATGWLAVADKAAVSLRQSLFTN